MFVPEPDGTPQNVSGHNRGSASISVSWDQVPVEQENGIITGYTITYHSQSQNHNGTVPAGPSERQKTITGLKEFVNYNITVLASTVKGDGPPSSPVLIVKTGQDSKLCICYQPSLYFNISRCFNVDSGILLNLTICKLYVIIKILYF